MFPVVPEGAPVLTAAAMRAAEDRAIAAGSSVAALMECAGTGVAEWVHRLAAGSEVLILCGPGNNGGDGYVAARVLASRGVPVRVAALGEPKTAGNVSHNKDQAYKTDCVAQMSQIRKIRKKVVRIMIKKED